MTGAELTHPPPAVVRKGGGNVAGRMQLPGGRHLTVRRETPHDAAGLVAMYDRMGADDLYCRFFTAHRPPDAFIERMTHVHDRGGVGLVAVMDRGRGRRRLVGEASYELLTDGDGELGIAVDRDARGWLGPYLLELLIRMAADRGVPALEADVLMSNRRMLALLRARGYVVLDHFDSPATLRVSVATAGPAPAWPGPHDRPRLLVEIPGGQWHLAAAMEKRGFQVVACPGPDRGGPVCRPLYGRPCPLAAGADVILEAQTGTLAKVLAGAHPRLHPGVPTCAVPRPGEQAADGRPALPPGDEAAIGDFLEDLAGGAGRDLGP